MNLARTIAPAIASVLALGVFAGPALADPQMAVPYGDLNFNHAQAASTLDARLVRASRQVCSTSSRALQDVLRSQECQREALADARAKAVKVQETMVALNGNQTPGR